MRAGAGEGIESEGKKEMATKKAPRGAARVNRVRDEDEGETLRTSFALSSAMKEWLDSESQRTGIPVSLMIRLVLEKWKAATEARGNPFAANPFLDSTDSID